MSTDVYRTTPASDPSTNEDMDLAADLVDILEEVPSITEEEIVDRHAPRSVHRDEFGAALWKDQYDFQERDIILPGFGDRREDCGVEIPHICSDCGYRVSVGRTCKQSQCPRCAPAWVMERAEGIVSRIWSAAKMKDGAQYKHHVAVDPPKELYVDAEDPWQECLDVLGDFLRRIEFDGVVLAHPYRGDHDEDDHEVGFAEGHADDRGEWKKRLFNEREWDGDVREELKFTPHFHIIGCAGWFPGGDVTAEIYEQTGWMFHRITRDGNSQSLGGIESVARAVAYSLSHVGIDVSGERNHYLRKKIGSAYHNADGRHDAAAADAVRTVAPKTLGMPSMEIECRADVPEDERPDDQLPEVTDADGDGDLEADSSSTTTDGMVSCRGDLVDVDDAEFVDDEDWQQTALFAEDAVEARREWHEAGGWQGWVGQATIDDDPPPD